MKWERIWKFIVTILLLAVSLAIFGIAVWRTIVFGDIESYVLLVLGAVCVGLWVDEFIHRLRMGKNERRGKDA